MCSSKVLFTETGNMPDLSYRLQFANPWPKLDNRSCYVYPPMCDTLAVWQSCNQEGIDLCRYLSVHQTSLHKQDL